MPQADAILIDGYFFSPEQGACVAEAAAISNGVITSLGSASDMKKLVGPETRVIDLEGRVVLPGFSDSHVHGLGVGLSKLWVDLSSASSISEVVEALRGRCSSSGPGEWVVGFGWDHERFSEKRLPTREDLDAISREKPIVIFRRCGHLCVVNSAILEKLGDRLQDLISNGRALLDASTKQPNGILVEEGVDAVRELLPLSESSVLRAVREAIEEALRRGLTCLHWIARGSEDLAAIMALRASGELRIRIYLFFPVEMLPHLLALGLRTGFGDPWVRVGGVKLLLDGSLGARTAYLREPYADQPSERGKLLYGEKELRELALRAHGAGLQLAIHAVGDGAVELALKVLSELPGGPGRMRHRIEHASVLGPGLIKMMAGLGVVASVQPRFVVSDFWVEERLGPSRARWAYPFRSMLKAGIPLAAGSDAPVEPMDPLEGISAAIGEAQRPEERLGLWEAIQIYTYGPAYASFQENVSGSLGVGKLADLTVLSCGPEELRPEAIGDIRVDATFVCGQLAYARTELPEF